MQQMLHHDEAARDVADRDLVADERVGGEGVQDEHQIAHAEGKQIAAH